MMDKGIEELLKSPNPLDCFTEKTVDPQKFVDLAAAMIAYSGDEFQAGATQALVG